jgi:hypothetical protein
MPIVSARNLGPCSDFATRCRHGRPGQVLSNRAVVAVSETHSCFRAAILAAVRQALPMPRPGTMSPRLKVTGRSSCE